MATGKDVLKVAQSQLGYKETPSGSNKTKYGKEYGLNGVAWCAIFVWWVFKHAGCPQLFYGGGKCAYCPTIADYYIARKQTVSKGSGKAGDIVLFGFGHTNSQHIGIIESKNSDGTYNCIEGNTSTGNNCNGGMVMRRKRYQSQINWIVRPKYEDLKPVDKPTGKYSGTLPTSLVKYGTKGNDTLLWQKFLNWYHADWKLAEDGECGSATTEATSIFQLTEGITADGEAGNDTYARAKAYLEEPEKKSYTGTFPTLPYALEKEAVKLAYAYKTAKSTYLYKGGKPKAAYKTALNKVYPNRSGWGAKSKAGASCDVFVGTCTRSSGENSDMPRGLSGQKSFLPKHFTKIGKAVSGAILYRANHVAIAVSLKGVMYQLNAHHDSMGGTYGMTQKGLSNFTAYYLPSKVSYFSKGDTFTEVKYLQAFLNWFGGYGLALDCDFGDATEKAVKDFQSKNGLTVDGQFGKACLAKAKEIKK